MESKKTFVTLVLDETGSMESIKDDTIGGFNRYVQELKDSQEMEYFFPILNYAECRACLA